MPEVMYRFVPLVVRGMSGVRQSVFWRVECEVDHDQLVIVRTWVDCMYVGEGREARGWVVGL